MAECKSPERNKDSGQRDTGNFIVETGWELCTSWRSGPVIDRLEWTTSTVEFSSFFRINYIPR